MSDLISIRRQLSEVDGLYRVPEGLNIPPGTPFIDEGLDGAVWISPPKGIKCAVEARNPNRFYVEEPFWNVGPMDERDKRDRVLITVGGRRIRLIWVEETEEWVEITPHFMLRDSLRQALNRFGRVDATIEFYNEGEGS